VTPKAAVVILLQDDLLSCVCVAVELGSGRAAMVIVAPKAVVFILLQGGLLSHVYVSSRLGSGRAATVKVTLIHIAMHDFA
jgi:hypothetical protein